MLFHCLGSNCVAVTSALAPRASGSVTGLGLPDMREAKTVRASLPLQFQRSVSRAPLSPTCLTVKTIRVSVAGLLPHLWNYGNSSLHET